MPIFEIPDPRTWTRILFQRVHKQRETSAFVKNAQSYRPTSEDLVPEPKDEREKDESRSSPVFHWQSIVLKAMILAETMKRWLFYYVIIVGHHPFVGHLGYFHVNSVFYNYTKHLLSKMNVIAIKIMHKLYTTVYSRWGKLWVFRTSIGIGTSTIFSYSVLMPLKCSSFVFVFIYCVFHFSMNYIQVLQKKQCGWLHQIST